MNWAVIQGICLIWVMNLTVRVSSSQIIHVEIFWKTNGSNNKVWTLYDSLIRQEKLLVVSPEKGNQTLMSHTVKIIVNYLILLFFILLIF